MGEFRFYHAIPDRSDFLEHASLNVLVSAYRISLYPTAIKRHLHLAKSVFLDSGVITLLKDGDADGVRRWMERQGDLAELAFHLQTFGVQNGLCAMMDHPCEPWLLAGIGKTVAQAVDQTVANAKKWQQTVLPRGWKRVYVAQGWTIPDYAFCMDAYEQLGILDEIRKGEAWLAAGTTCMREPPSLYSVYQFLRDRLGAGHLHALGIARAEWVGHLYREGWINSADSATGSFAVGFNRGAYQWKGRRPTYLVSALYAAEMEVVEDAVMESLTTVPAERQLDFFSLEVAQ